jgi:cobalt/nickel transport system permease protein
MPPACRLSSAEIARAASTKKELVLACALALALAPAPARAMHLADGILPLGWAALWWVVAAAFAAVGLVRLRGRAAVDRRARPLAAMVAALVFVVSCMPIPIPLVGTCSHPCGTGLAAILVGPWLTVLVSAVALTLQALFLAHGGFTSLGANVVSMGIAGAFAGWAVFAAARRLGASATTAAFAAGAISDWATYAVTSAELASALHGSRSFGTAFLAVALAFVPTQLPLGILEGVVSAGAVRLLLSRRPDLVPQLGGAPGAARAEVA